MTLRSIRRCWPVCLVLAFTLHSQTIQAQEAIRKIEIVHVGPPVASDDMIRGHLRVKVGDDYNDYVQSGSDADTRSLYGTGLFANIRVVREPRPEGLTVVFVVQGKLKLAEISFQGNQFLSAAKLLRTVTSKQGEPLDEQKIFTDARALEALYEKEGYQGTKVQYRLTPEESIGRGSVTFEIAERPKVMIQEVTFEGASAFPPSTLRKVVTTKRRGILSWLDGTGILKEEETEVDKAALIEFYLDAGYADVEIKQLVADYFDPTHVRLRFVLSEGIRYNVGTIEVRGNAVFKSEEILHGGSGATGLLMKSGDIFTPNRLESDTDRVRDFYHRRGYLDTDVRALKIPNTAKGTIDIVFEILDEARGPSYLELIEIRGNTRTKDNVIRRELAVAPTDVFDYVTIQRSRDRVQGMGFFTKVEMFPEDTDIADRKNLIVTVEELERTRLVEFQALFVPDEGFAGAIGFRESNFDLFNPPYFQGAGEKLRADIALGTERKSFDLSFVAPWFLDYKLQFETGVYHRYLNYRSDLYDIRQSGVHLGVAQPLGSEFLVGRATYTLENIGLLNMSASAPATIQAEAGERLVSKFGLSIALDTRDSYRYPKHGGRVELAGEVAGGVLGGDSDFYSIELRSAWYFPGALADHVIEVRGRAGVADTFGRAADLPVPLFNRFFLGGSSSIRRYGYGAVGPSQDGEPVGGQTYWFGSVKYSLPVTEQLRLATFYDAGNVFVDPFSFGRRPGQRAYTDDVGVGFRYETDLGPLRLDYAFPISHDASVGGGGRFKFSVGWTSEF